MFLFSDVIINNSLGSGIDIEVYDSASSEILLTLKDGEATGIPCLRTKKDNSLKSAAASGFTAISAVDIHFLGEFGKERLDLHHLPFNVNKPHTYSIQPRGSAGVGVGGVSGLGLGQAHPLVVLEPIVEEVFENSRYDPITIRWRKPFLHNDPFEYTDASGTIRKDIQEIQLQSNKWEWIDSWAVDMDVSIGEGLDKEGFEYSTNFSTFSISNKRRANNVMDCVRRRRWVRTRAPTASSVDEKDRPLIMFWDVHVLENGTKRVEIRSGLQVKNVMPFAIVLSLSGAAWTGDMEFGPIEENEMFSIPIRQASASGIKIRPASFPYQWSQSVTCNLQIYDFSSMRDVQCEVEKDVEGEEAVKVCMRVLTTQSSRSLMVTGMVATFVIGFTIYSMFHMIKFFV